MTEPPAPISADELRRTADRHEFDVDADHSVVDALRRAAHTIELQRQGNVDLSNQLAAWRRAILRVDLTFDFQRMLWTHERKHQ